MLAQSFLQGLMGNIMVFNSIQKKITDAEAKSDKATSAYQWGRLAYYIITFEPVDLGENPRDNKVSAIKFDDSIQRNFFQDRFNDLMTVSGASGPVAQIIDSVENFFSSFFAASIGSVAPSSVTCSANATVFYQGITQTKDLILNGSYNSSAITLR